jgi:hypothetical protein
VSYETFRLIVWAIGLPIIVYLAVRAARRWKEIQRLDAELREEEAQAAKDPYANMAKMYEAQELLQKSRRGGSEK